MLHFQGQKLIVLENHFKKHYKMSYSTISHRVVAIANKILYASGTLQSITLYAASIHFDLTALLRLANVIYSGTIALALAISANA